MLAYIQQARCYLLKSDIEQASKILKKSKELDFDASFFGILAKAHNKEDIKGAMVTAISRFNTLLKSSKEGKIISKKDVHWYKGVLQFYTAQFSKAKESFERIENDEGSYNKALCALMTHSYEEALISLHKIVIKSEGKDRGKLLLLMGLLQIGLSNTEEAKELITESFKYDPETVNAYLDESSDVKILPLQSSSKLATTFPMAKLSIGECKPILIRPSFTLPSQEVPDLKFTTLEEVTSYFDVSRVNSKAEPPWMNRVGGLEQGNVPYFTHHYLPPQSI